MSIRSNDRCGTLFVDFDAADEEEGHGSSPGFTVRPVTERVAKLGGEGHGDVCRGWMSSLCDCGSASPFRLLRRD